MKALRCPASLRELMILFNRQVLFVHNPKTAGTSVLRFLEQVLPDVAMAGVNELGTHLIRSLKSPSK